jgi:S-adenosylmethionine:tRNA ribosyltransferase-isomerase
VLDRRRESLEHRFFRELPEILEPRALVVRNRSRVFPARLLGTRSGGGRAEVLLVRARAGDEWEALVRPGRRLRAGASIRVGDDLEVLVTGEPDLADGRRVVRLLAREGSVEQALERRGHVPLPPYIRRPDRPEDRGRYQTIFARERGSVAAPTAGLHFAEATFARLRERDIRIAEVVLHVGPGTFRPVQAEDVREHRVPAEPFLLPAETADAVFDTRAAGGRVVAVGTTTTRVLESRVDEKGVLVPGEGETDLVIVPPFTFRAVDVLLTNFHLPRSSLLLLVAAFAGRERVLEAYAEAIRAGYRFYSYGDAMLVL